MEKKYTKMPDKCEDHFNIIKLCLAHEDQTAGDAQGNKEAKKKSPIKSNDDDKVESDNTDVEFYAKSVLSRVNREFFRFLSPEPAASSSSTRLDTTAAFMTPAPVQAAAAAESLAPVAAFAEDIQKIQKFMTDYVTFYNQNPQPWKEDLERIEQEHKRQLQECQTEILGLHALNQELARDVTLKIEQLKICDGERQREHSELMQIIDEKSKQIDNLEKEQQNVKTCLKAFEGLYKNLYENINHLKAQSVDLTTQPKTNSNSEVERSKQMGEETVALVRQEVIKRMDSCVGEAFQNLRIMLANNETVAATSPMALAQKPAPSVQSNDTAKAMMPRLQQQQANLNATSQALQNLIEVNTKAAEQRVQVKQPYAYNTKFKKQNVANTPRPKPQASAGNKMYHGGEGGASTGDSVPAKNVNVMSAAVDPRFMQSPNPNFNDLRLLMQLLQPNAGAQSILGQPPLMQLPASNIAGCGVAGGGGDNFSLGGQQQQQPHYKQANKQPHTANV